MATAKPNQKIHVDKLQATREKLDSLEKKQNLELTLRETIYLLRDKLRGALKKGYSYQDLSEILEQQGILVSAATLKQYLTETNKEASSRKRVGARGQTKQSSPKVLEKDILTSSESVTESKDKELAVGEEKDSSQLITSADDTTLLSQSEVNLSQSNNQASVSESQQDTKKPVRGKSKKLGSSNIDFSSEFNQY
ncbi:MAG TPA: hypothetical protein V6D09_21675 [Leptolyngbyaceae cyanobacterium]